MSVSEYVSYYNEFERRSFHVFERNTTKEEWAERFEFVYKCSNDYIALNKPVSDAYINYLVYKNKHLYTNDNETTSTMLWHLYENYYNKHKKQSALKFQILKIFKEKFPSIKKPACDIEHYIECCVLYESHRLKGKYYNLPFPVETNTPAPVDFQVEVPPENKCPQNSGGTWDGFTILEKKSKPSLLGIKEKKKNVKKHTLSILLTQEKEKTRKLQEILEQKGSTLNPVTN